MAVAADDNLMEASFVTNTVVTAAGELSAQFKVMQAMQWSG